jgi:hypothetical protein
MLQIWSFFISQVQVVLPVVAFDFLRPKPNPSHVKMAGVVSTPLPQQSELVLESGKYGFEARAWT